MKIGWGVWPLGLWGEKSQKVTRGSHRNEVSPLTQGLRYRAASETLIFFRHDIAATCVLKMPLNPNHPSVHPIIKSSQVFIIISSQLLKHVNPSQGPSTSAVIQSVSLPQQVILTLHATHTISCPLSIRLLPQFHQYNTTCKVAGFISSIKLCIMPTTSCVWLSMVLRLQYRLYGRRFLQHLVYAPH